MPVAPLAESLAHYWGDTRALADFTVQIAAPPVALYEGRRLAGAFERTASRLIEMQSAEYLARTHRG